MSLKGRVCVVTGATGNLGRVLAGRFAAEGASLALISTSPEKLAELSALLNHSQVEVWSGAFDLRSPRAARQAADAVHRRFGRVDILVHAVGGWLGGKSLVEVPPEDMMVMLDQHLWTTFHTAQNFIPHMISGGWGRLIAISSPSAMRPGPRGAPYAVGKAALEALLLSLAADLKGTGVTANILQVGSIDVERRGEQAPSPASSGWTTPEEIAAAILYLCSPEGGRLNGARLPLFG